MKPITFSCKTNLSLAPSEIAAQILDIANWQSFQGYGPLPGIKSAVFEARTPAVVGSRIRVQNTDGSAHVEVITAWLPERRIALRMQEFSAPLRWLATGIDETWEWEHTNGETKVVRSFQLHARSALTRPFLWLISKLLKRAIARHLRQISTVIREVEPRLRLEDFTDPFSIWLLEEVHQPAILQPGNHFSMPVKTESRFS